MVEKRSTSRSRSVESDHRDESSKKSDAADESNNSAVLLTNQEAKKKWAGWQKRFWPTWIGLAFFFSLLYWGRQEGLGLMVLCAQAKIFQELVSIQINYNKERELPGFNFFYFFWFFTATLWFFGRQMMPLLEYDAWLFQVPVLGWVLRKHYSVCFGLYLAGIVAFVISLRKEKMFRYQFSQFAYCHMALFMVVWNSTFIVGNLYHGLIWMFLPGSMVMCNDIWAYVFGFFFGRTPLVPYISPKKTWEGFLGAFFATIVWSVGICWVIETTTAGNFNQILLCPKTGLFPMFAWNEVQCDVASLHGGIHQLHPLGTFWFARAVPDAVLTWSITEMQLHAVVLAVMASLIAPFGGFFASGFKRAFKIKDFDQVIPGHGGILDRMDCQIVMGSLVYMYAWHVLDLDSAHAGTGDLEGHGAAFAALWRMAAQLPEVGRRALMEQLAGNLNATVTFA